jgi:hypoxanthine-DNA glycosylase
MAEYKHSEHEFPPVFDENSRILILGSLPSVKSREQGFYYGHPQNRFWKVIAGIYQCPVPDTIESKTEMLKHYHIAIWDVIASCDIIGSSDSSIKNVIANDINLILDQCDIQKIYVNGKTAGKLYNKYSKENTGKEIIELPSTSPANAAYSLERLKEAWNIILE